LIEIRKSHSFDGNLRAMEKYRFSGHETFYCRHYWLKKGIDFVQNQGKFTKKQSVVDLGVGKNMVASIRFWLKAFNLIEESEGTARIKEVANDIFVDNGFDPYAEDIGTLWLLHYFLVKTEMASLYSLTFNEFRRTRIEFTNEHLQRFVAKKCSLDRFQYNENTIKRDVNVFFNNYVASSKSNSVEDNFSGLLTELGIVEKLGKIGKERERWFRIENTERENLSALIVLYVILDNPKYGDSIRFDELLTDNGSVGSIFALNPDGLFKKIKTIQSLYPNIVYTDDGGIRLLQFKEKPTKESVLERYYKN
jgi:hypothetical protein